VNGGKSSVNVLHVQFLNIRSSTPPIVTHVAWCVLRVSVCVCWSGAWPCKTDEPIEMPFEVWTHGDPRNRVLRGGPDPTGKGHFGEFTLGHVQACLW